MKSEIKLFVSDVNLLVWELSKNNHTNGFKWSHGWLEILFPEFEGSIFMCFSFEYSI